MCSTRDQLGLYVCLVDEESCGEEFQDEGLCDEELVEEVLVDGSRRRVDEGGVNLIWTTGL